MIPALIALSTTVLSLVFNFFIKYLFAVGNLNFKSVIFVALSKFWTPILDKVGVLQLYGLLLMVQPKSSVIPTKIYVSAPVASVLTVVATEYTD